MDGAGGARDTRRMSQAAPITLLPATLADALPLALLSRDLVEVGLPWSWRPDRIAAAVQDPESVVLLARSGPEIAGFATMLYHDRNAHLSLLAVAPRWRRAGVGSRLIEWLETTALVAGVEWIGLEVRARNKGARTFYEHLGYQARDYVPGYYRGRESAIRMRRDLRPAAPADLTSEGA